MYSYAFVHIRMHLHAHACSLLRNIQPNFEYLVLCSDGQPHLVASSLTDVAEMERFLLKASACFCFSMTEMHHLDLVHGLASGDDDRVEFFE